MNMKELFSPLRSLRVSNANNSAAAVADAPPTMATMEAMERATQHLDVRTFDSAVPSDVSERITRSLALLSGSIGGRESIYEMSDSVGTMWTSAERTIPDKPSTDMLRRMIAPEANTDARSTLAMAVEDQLGYTPLRDAVKAPSRLQRVLQELEIDAFYEATVQDYRLRMAAHHQARLNDGKTREEVFRSLSRSEILYGSERAYYTRAIWQDVPLAAYSKPVPEFVLRKCLAIRERLPQAEFIVCELVAQRRTLDPFLYVRLGSESLAIEVWDEPEFERAM